MRRFAFFIIIIIYLFTGCTKEPVNIQLHNLQDLESSSLVSPAGGTFKLQMEVNASWSIENHAEWLQVSPASGSEGQNSILLTSTVNATDKGRTAELVIRAGEQTLPFSIHQKSSKISASKKSLHAPLEGMKEEIEIITQADSIQVSFTEPAHAQWIKVLPMASESKLSKKYSVEILKNNSGGTRSSSITFSNGGAEVSVSVLQDGATLVIPQKEINAGCAAGQAVLYVDTNIEYEISDLPEWITLGEVSLPLGRAILNVKENNTGSERSAQVTVRSEYAPDMKVTVRQEAETENMLSWARKEFPQKSLVTKFTGSWCKFCPRMSDVIDAVMQRNPEKVVTMSVYDSDSNGTLAYYNYNGIAGLYPLGTSMPETVVDSKAVLLLSDKAVETMEKLVLETQAVKALCHADIDFKINGDKMSLDIKAYAKVAGDYKIVINLLEDGISSPQAGVNGEYIHNHVLKDSFTAEDGQDLNFRHGGIQSLHFDRDLPVTVNNPKNCKIQVVFLKSVPAVKTQADMKFVHALVPTKFILDNVIVSK